LKLFLTTVLVFVSVVCFAQHHIAMGASTNGVGVSYRHSINSVIDVGGSFYYIQLKGNTQNVILDNIVNSNYAASSPLIEGFVQWKPFAAANANKLSDDVVNDAYSKNSSPFKEKFYIKSGLALRLNSKLSSNSTFWEKTMIGNFQLTPDQVGYVNINVKTNTIQPMVAIGYPLLNGEKIFMTVEAGTYFHGAPKVTMEATGTLHLNTVNQRAIQNVASKYIFYPLLKIEAGIKL
jgi:hypothetical protein